MAVLVLANLVRQPLRSAKPPGLWKTSGRDLAARRSTHEAFAANAEPAGERTPMINWTAASFGIGSMATAPAEAALARSSRTHADR